MISVTSSLTPSIVENSCNTPLILIEVIAVPCREESKTLLKANDLDHTKRIKDFTEDEISKIRKSIEESYTVEGDLRRVVSQNIKRLKDLGCYRGLRHRRQLPTRGQRTHTNARTRKGKAVAIAGKKKVTK